MSEPDWRDASAYEALRSHDAPAFAWEYLRRNPEFKRHHARLERAVRRGVPEQADLDAFARRWGCEFICGATETLGPGAVLWSAHALPSVVALSNLPAGLADPKFKLPALPFASGHSGDPAERLIEAGPAVFRVHVERTGAEPPAVLLPLDRLFEIRAAAAVRLWRGVTGRSLGPDPAVLSKMRRDRLRLGLRALDARRENASYREIADVLFGPVKLPPREWKIDDLRSRTIRLVRFGLDVMQGGYRRLLLLPYRRRS